MHISAHRASRAPGKDQAAVGLARKHDDVARRELELGKQSGAALEQVHAAPACTQPII